MVSCCKEIDVLELYDKVHEILLYPNNFIILTVNGKDYRFRLLEDGSLVGVTSGIMCKIYQADEKYRITPEKLDRLHSKYAALGS